MLTREEVAKQYEIDEDGIITSPGKFEGYMWWIVNYYELFCKSLFDSYIYDKSGGDELLRAFLDLDKDDLDIVMPDEYDLEAYTYTMRMREDDQGFIHMSIDEDEIFVSVEEQMKRDGAEDYELVFYLDDSTDIEAALSDLMGEVSGAFPYDLVNEGSELDHHRGRYTYSEFFRSVCYVEEVFGQGIDIAGKIDIEVNMSARTIECYASFNTTNDTVVGELLSDMSITSSYDFDSDEWDRLEFS